ncbi:MAG: hypothetical protein N2109_07580 [Fimbriimonadales bacterium]|nr:hypothetical protein [Fimbriimonadales bacterium]
MARLHTLTVQDVLWINFRLVGRPVPFDYAVLEDASYCQYQLGKSLDVPRQAARLLQAMVRRKPFEAGNVETGLVATAAFLRINGFRLEPSAADAVAWAVSFSGDTLEPFCKPEPHDDEEEPDVHETIVGEMERLGLVSRAL